MDEATKAAMLERARRERARRQQGAQPQGFDLGTWLNRAGEAATFGLVGDEAAARFDDMIGRGDYDDRLQFYRDNEEALRENNPGASLGADLTGAALGMALPFGLAGTAGRGAGLAARVGRSAAAGAGMGGTYGFMEGEGLDDRLTGARDGAVLGGLVGAAVPALGAGVQKAADSRAARRKIRGMVQNAPSTEELRRSAKEAYAAVDNAGVQIKPEAFDRLRSGMTNAMDQAGLDPLPGPGSLTPKGARVAQIADEMSSGMAAEPTAALPFSSLDKLRRHAGVAAADVSSGKATPDAKIGMEAISQVDDFVRGLGVDDVVEGDPAALQSAIGKARDLYARMSRSQLLDDAIESAADYRTGEASGLRAQFQRIVKNPRLRRGFSDAEVAMMRKVVNGSLPEQMLNYAGSGLGMMGQVAVGGIGGGIPGALAGAATGGLSRLGAERMVRQGAENARGVVAAGGLENLPVASDTTRRIIESMIRRSSAVGGQ